MVKLPRETQSDLPGAEEPLREPLSSLSVELSRISAEIQSINSGFQAQIQQAFAETQAAMEAEQAVRLKQAAERMRQEFEVELERRDARLAALHREAERVASLLKDISDEMARMIDDPGVELSLVMRKKAEQADLRAYLGGLSYGIDPRSVSPGED